MISCKQFNCSYIIFKLNSSLKKKTNKFYWTQNTTIFVIKQNLIIFTNSMGHIKSGVLLPGYFVKKYILRWMVAMRFTTWPCPTTKREATTNLGKKLKNPCTCLLHFLTNPSCGLTSSQKTDQRKSLKIIFTPTSRPLIHLRFNFFLAKKLFKRSLCKNEIENIIISFFFFNLKQLDRRIVGRPRW